jgi:hypothetical protein
MKKKYQNTPFFCMESSYVYKFHNNDKLQI